MQPVSRTERRRSAPRARGVAAFSGLAAIAALGVAYARRLEPWYQAWGATDAELTMSLPIDDLVTPGCERSTRAITVESSAENLWTWLVQIGQDRGGFYSYTPLENIVGARMRNASEIVAEWQHLSTGDTVWLADESLWHDRGKQTVALVQPARALVLVAPDDWQRLQSGARAHAAWGFFVEPIDDERCRLIVRSSGGPDSRLFALVHFVMEQKMMRGLRDRAEHTHS